MKNKVVPKMNTVIIDSQSLHKNQIAMKDQLSNKIMRFLSQKKHKEKQYTITFKIEKLKSHKKMNYSTNIKEKEKKNDDNNQQQNVVANNKYKIRTNKTNPSNIIDLQQKSSKIIKQFQILNTPKIIDEQFQFREFKDNNKKQRSIFTNTLYPHTYRSPPKNIKPLQQIKQKINPYTKDQYIYMRNKKNDQIIQLKKEERLKKTNSIIKSYQIATIQLNPHYHQRSISFNPRIQTPNNTVTLQRRNLNRPRKSLQLVMKQSQKPQPWQWNGLQQSKLEF